MQPQQQQPNGVDGADGANGIGDIDGPLQRPPQNHRDRRPKDASRIGVKTNYTSEDGFITVSKKNRRRERPVFGNGADDVITKRSKRVQPTRGWTVAASTQHKLYSLLLPPAMGARF